MTMRLYFSATSPYVRKVRVLAQELGLADGIEMVAATVSPVESNTEISARNPLAKLPTLVLDDGSTLYDSRVIAEYLLAQAPGQTLLPAFGAARWPMLRRQALCDGILDAALLVRYEETLRPAERRWPEWAQGQEDKIRRGLAQLELEAGALDAGKLTLDAIATGCMLGYLDLRFARLAWRESAPALAAFEAVFAQRPAMLATRPG